MLESMTTQKHTAVTAYKVEHTVLCFENSKANKTEKFEYSRRKTKILKSPTNLHKTEQKTIKLSFLK